MTRNVITCSPEDGLADIMRQMMKHRIRHLPVKREHELVGIVSIRDVLACRLDEVERNSKVLLNWLSDLD